MANEMHPATFEQLGDLEAESPTLIEGFPGHGLVAAIAVDQVTNQLGLEHFGNIYSDDFPPVVTFTDGLVQDLVRVYAGENPPVMTLKSDLALPPQSFEPLSQCVLGDLATEFDRAVFLAGAAAESEEQIGEIIGVATDPAVKADLVDAGIELGDDPGLVGGVTGALVRECYHAGIPAALLVVRAHPFLPDPEAARSVIENALEPLVDFDIDTGELKEQAEEIRKQMQQIAEHYQQMAAEQEPPQPAAASMFQ
ncbi:MAG: proteasome assembly chaperone family protein [Halobacteriales archaeon]